MHTLRTTHSISKLDIVISNSGIAKHIGPALETPVKELQDHFKVNTVSHLLLFQATWPLLTAAPAPGPKFIVISSSVGSISGMEREPVPMLAYGCSKAATNYLVRKLHFEHEKWVGTGMGWFAAKAYGVEEPPNADEGISMDPSAVKPLTVGESVDALVLQAHIANDSSIRCFSGFPPSVDACVLSFGLAVVRASWKMAPLDLLSLPNEVITQVIDELDLTDTWSIAQTSKMIHHVSQSAMKRHREYKAEYSIVRLGEPYIDNDDPRFEGSPPLVFLEQIIRERRIASYVTDLRLSILDNDYRPDLSAIDDCPWVVDDVALLIPTGAAHQVAFLLTLLPNLRSMAMRCMSHGFVPITEMVWKIAQANQNISSAAHGKALSKLTKISIEHHDTENGQDLVFYASFMSLPSMRSLYGHMMYGEANGQDAIDAYPGSAEYDGLGIADHLRKYASHSLQHLDLTCDMSYNEEDQFVGDLREFKLLQTLRLNAKAFCEEVDYWSSRPEVEYDRLADTLPTSIQAVTLVGWFADNGPLDLAKLIEERNKLPELRRINLEGKTIMPTNEDIAHIINSMYALGRFTVVDPNELEDHTCYCCCEESLTATNSSDFSKEVPVRLTCGHVFGMACLLRWSLEKLQQDLDMHCPQCRAVYCYTGGELESPSPAPRELPALRQGAYDPETRIWRSRRGAVLLRAPRLIENPRSSPRSTATSAESNDGSTESNISLRHLRRGRRNGFSEQGAHSSPPDDFRLPPASLPTRSRSPSRSNFNAAAASRPNEPIDDAIDYGSLSSDDDDDDDMHQDSPPPRNVDDEPGPTHDSELFSPPTPNGLVSDNWSPPTPYHPDAEPSDLALSPITSPASLSPHSSASAREPLPRILRAEGLWHAFLDHITSQSTLNDYIQNRDPGTDLTVRARAVELILTFETVSEFYDAWSQGGWTPTVFERAWFGEPFEALETLLDTLREVGRMNWVAYEALEYEEGVVERLEGFGRRLRRHWKDVRKMMVRENRMVRMAEEGDEMDVE
ncbi:MAG: hypothetical protein Q9215_008045 [Flavoplaca cf. flavocitrina]